MIDLSHLCPEITSMFFPTYFSYHVVIRSLGRYTYVNNLMMLRKFITVNLLRCYLFVVTSLVINRSTYIGNFIEALQLASLFSFYSTSNIKSSSNLLKHNTKVHCEMWLVLEFVRQ